MNIVKWKRVALLSPATQTPAISKRNCSHLEAYGQNVLDKLAAWWALLPLLPCFHHSPTSGSLTCEKKGCIGVLRYTASSCGRQNQIMSPRLCPLDFHPSEVPGRLSSYQLAQSVSKGQEAFLGLGNPTRMKQSRSGTQFFEWSPAPPKHPYKHRS